QAPASQIGRDAGQWASSRHSTQPRSPSQKPSQSECSRQLTHSSSTQEGTSSGQGSPQLPPCPAAPPSGGDTVPPAPPLLAASAWSLNSASHAANPTLAKSKAASHPPHRARVVSERGGGATDLGMWEDSWGGPEGRGSLRGRAGFRGTRRPRRS